MRLPRNLSGEELIKKLAKLGYLVTRQSGSHIRLTKIQEENEYHLTIPNHNPLKIGTLNNIFQDIASQSGLHKAEVIKQLL